MTHPDNQPADPAYGVRIGGTSIRADRPLTQTADDNEPEPLLREGTDLIGLILESARIGAIALTKMRDKRTGIEYVGIVLVHPDDRDAARLNGAGRKFPCALLITEDLINHIEPVLPKRAKP
jgi:hypothetical protein